MYLIEIFNYERKCYNKDFTLMKTTHTSPPQHTHPDGSITWRQSYVGAIQLFLILTEHTLEPDWIVAHRNQLTSMDGI